MNGPLASLEDWDDFVEDRYRPGKERESFRVYDTAPPGVREFYHLNHTNQTHEFALSKRKQYGGLNQRSMSIWEAMEFLNTLVDDSDPDTNLSQIEHNLQTAEAIRRDGYPGWMQLTGLIHDLGKVLCLYGEPQWAVVGDTFPTGCAWSEKIVFSEFFRENPDRDKPELQTKLGVYEEGCGLDNVKLSWGHDEYMYTICRDYLPDEALAMIRYHSCYPIHREGAYDYLLTDRDRELLDWVKKFNPYDLYSKGDERVNVDAVRPYYESLIAEYFPEKVRF